jgi:RNA polymerase sigma-70 factor (ECF subfamily)
MDTGTTGADPAAAAGGLSDRAWRDAVTQLRAFVRRRIADPDRAEDLVSEILLRIHQRIASVDDRERLTHWISAVARNAVIDEYRRAGRERERLLPAPAHVAAAAPGPGYEDPGAAVEELSHCLRPLLAGLPRQQQRAVELIDLAGWSTASAARHEGVSVSGMKSRVQRGRQKLAELLRDCCALTLDGRGLPMDYTTTSRQCGCGDER